LEYSEPAQVEDKYSLSRAEQKASMPLWIAGADEWSCRSKN
jgi:hypothetical protein